MTDLKASKEQVYFIADSFSLSLHSAADKCAHLFLLQHTLLFKKQNWSKQSLSKVCSWEKK